MSLDFPSLYLELVVLRALDRSDSAQLADNILVVFRHLSSKFEQSVVADPANSNNILSNDLSTSDRKAVAKAARDALYDENWKKILW